MAQENGMVAPAMGMPDLEGASGDLAGIVC
jgi:hypothetical protein